VLRIGPGVVARVLLLMLSGRRLLGLLWWGRICGTVAAHTSARYLDHLRLVWARFRVERNELLLPVLLLIGLVGGGLRWRRAHLLL
jgi:hypothetical protein